MDAIVSGSANVAVVVEADGLRSLRRTITCVERQPRQPRELRYIFGDAQDLSFLENVDEAAVLTELDLAHAGVEALHLALMLCDPDTSARAAGLGAGEIEALLTRPEVAERAERILDAKPMPAPFSTGIAVARCRAPGGVDGIAFFEALAARQPAIRVVRRAWDVLPSSLFADAEERAFAEGVLAREGLFRSLVRVCVANASVDDWLAEALRSPATSRWRAERWLGAWVRELRDCDATTAPEYAADKPSQGNGNVVATFPDPRFSHLCRNPRAVEQARTIARTFAGRGQVMRPAA